MSVKPNKIWLFVIDVAIYILEHLIKVSTKIFKSNPPKFK